MSLARSAGAYASYVAAPRDNIFLPISLVTTSFAAKRCREAEHSIWLPVWISPGPRLLSRRLMRRGGRAPHSAAHRQAPAKHVEFGCALRCVAVRAGVRWVGICELASTELCVGFGSLTAERLQRTDPHQWQRNELNVVIRGFNSHPSNKYHEYTTLESIIFKVVDGVDNKDGFLSFQVARRHCNNGSRRDTRGCTEQHRQVLELAHKTRVQRLELWVLVTNALRTFQASKRNRGSYSVGGLFLRKFIWQRARNVFATGPSRLWRQGSTEW